MLVWRLTLYQKRGGNALFAATSRRIKVFEQKTGGVFDTTNRKWEEMIMKAIYTEKAPAAVGPYSQAVVINGLVYTSGQIALDPTTGELVGTTIEEQAEQVMKNLVAILEAAGTKPENVVKTLCFLTDINDFAAFNAVYARYFTEKPARSCVGIQSLPKGAICEVEVIATV
jgi:2-iminobutanoate/2-iminopropanoate deaminase